MIVLNGRFSSSPFTIAGVMCGNMSSCCSDALFRSSTPFPTCACKPTAANPRTATTPKTAAATVIRVFRMSLSPQVRVDPSEHAELGHQPGRQRRRRFGLHHFRKQRPAAPRRVDFELERQVPPVVQGDADKT